MKITTWNVNGIRRFSGGKVKKMLDDIDADVFCVQETKIAREAITADVAIIEGYNSYFSFCYSNRKGYSGVATFCKDSCKPNRVYDHLSASGAEGTALGDTEVDGEGRAVIVEYNLKRTDVQEASTSEGNSIKIALINVYCVNYVPENTARFDYKMRHHALLEARLDAYRENGYHVIVLGDFNIAHKRIDHCEAHLMPDFDVQPHRVWLSMLLDKGYVDCFRHFHPTQEKAYTVWNQQTGARATNYGTRVDYFVADKGLFDLEVFTDCHHLTKYLGSDHCPLVLELKPNWVLESASELSPLCSKFLPEFRGTQKSIRSFLSSTVTTVAPQSKVIKKKPHGGKQSSLSNFFLKKETKAIVPMVVEFDEGVGASQSAESSSSSQSQSQPELAESLSSESQSVIVMEETKNCTSNNKNFLFPRKSALRKCSHGEPAVERTVKKKGPNFNRRFYACARPKGFAGDKNAQCNYFEWA